MKAFRERVLFPGAAGRGFQRVHAVCRDDSSAVVVVFSAARMHEYRLRFEP